MEEFVIKKNSEITDEILDKILEFDRTIFPEDEEYSFPDGYFRKIYSKNKYGIFVLFNKNNNVIGYVNCIFITDKNKEEFLETREYLKLENIGIKKGENNLYLYNLLIKKEYRDGQAIKLIMKEFCKWLKEEIKNGKIIKYCFSEAVTDDGIKTLKVMGMFPQDVNEDGMGIYYSKDNLEEYISNMLKMS